MAHFISDEYSSVRKHITVFGSISGNYSFRHGKTIWFESTLERDFILKQEFDTNVIDIVSQPVEIPYVTELGNNATYTPDFLVQFIGADGTNTKLCSVPILVEIKPRKKLQDDWHKLKCKFKAANKFAVSMGWKFKIFDENRVRDQYWKNLMFLRRFRKSFLADDEQQLLLAILDQEGVVEIKNLFLYLNKEQDEFQKIFTSILILLAKRILDCNFSSQINGNTKVWLNQKFVEEGHNV